MFRHLLVPLDGSLMAESALPAAARVARRVGAGLTIVHVIEKNAPKAVHSERHLVTPEEAEAYLAAVAGSELLRGLPVRRHVHEAEVRDVARGIYEHTSELDPVDCIVMSTHGTGGARRLIFGAIAQQVIGMGSTPVMLVREPIGVEEWRTILAPIDGEPAHEKGMSVAADLATAFGCGLRLLMVTPHLGELSGSQGATSILLPGATRLKLELDDDAAREHLASRAAELRGRGIPTECEASRGDPAAAIVKAARRLPADVVVMATHGRAGTGAFWQGSVAARVISRTRAPLLLVPIALEATSS
jgi:nucleotide-binding universal stress UspA family protein